MEKKLKNYLFVLFKKCVSYMFYVAWELDRWKQRLDKL